MNVLTHRYTPNLTAVRFTDPRIERSQNLAEGPDGHLDVFTPGVSDWTPPSRALLAQTVADNKARDPMKALGDLIRTTGRGGTLQRKDLQALCPDIFGLPQNIEQLPTAPNIFSFLDENYVGNLLYSNNPEKILKPNVLLSEAEVQAGTTRVMAHHFNNTDKTLRLVTTFQNNGDKPVHLTVQKDATSIERASPTTG